MKTTTLVVALLLAGTVFLAVAPTAEARGYCTWQDWWCPGDYCVWNYALLRWECVPIRCVFHCWIP